MARGLFPRGQTLLPYSRDLLEKAVASSKGRMKPGCKFRCTMYSREEPKQWHLPCVFFCNFVELDEGIRIDYRMFPGLKFWALLLLPFAAVAALVLLGVRADSFSAVGLLVAAVVVLFSLQREKAIERFERRFGK